MDDKKWLHIVLLSSDTGFGTIYVSDDRGMVYSKSLERHLYTATGGDNDFTNVTSLRGVFMTSVLAEGMTTCHTRLSADIFFLLYIFRNHLTWFLICCLDNSVQTVVTFDQGGEWVPLQKPENSQCDSTAKDKNKVRSRGRQIVNKTLNSRKLFKTAGCPILDFCSL